MAASQAAMCNERDLKSFVFSTTSLSEVCQKCYSSFDTPHNMKYRNAPDKKNTENVGWNVPTRL